MKRIILLLIILSLFVTSCEKKKEKQSDNTAHSRQQMNENQGPQGNPGPPPQGKGGMPPEGPPPDGMPPQGEGDMSHNGQPGPPPEGGPDMPPPDFAGKPGGDHEAKSVTIHSKVSVDKKDKTVNGKTIKTAKDDYSAVYSLNGGQANLSAVKIIKKGDASNNEASEFNGLNSAVLSGTDSSVTLQNSSISTSGEGANGVVATGKGASVTLEHVEITTTQNGSRGVHATYGGVINGKDLTISTLGAHCAALATDRGEGTVTVEKVTAQTEGEGSPGIYSTGAISAANSTFISNGSEGAVIEGKNSIELSNCTVTGNKLAGVMLYQSFSGDAGIGTSSFTMKGGSLTANEGALFYITNTKSVVYLESVALKSKSNILIKASENRWGRKGQNGGTVELVAASQEMVGDILCDSSSSISLQLEKNSTLTGTINEKSSEGTVAISLDKSSSWNVTGDSYVDSLSCSSTDSIISNGHTIYYNPDSQSNSWLKGKTVKLKDNGQLKPLHS